MPEQLDIRSLSVTGAAKPPNVAPKTVREHVHRGLPPAGKRIELIVYGPRLRIEQAGGTGENNNGRAADVSKK